MLSADKKSFFKLLGRAAKPRPARHEETLEVPTSDDYTDKKTRSRTSEDASEKRNGKSR